MSHQDASDTSQRAAQFFMYFRDRLATATGDGLPYYDRMVLLAACIDALANHWHSTADRAVVPSRIPSAERMRLFLQRHGQHRAFDKVLRRCCGISVGSSS